MARLHQFLYILKRHWIILLSGALLTALVSLQIILFPFLARDSYQGINIAHFGTDAHYYLTRGKEILEGHGLGNIVLREGKDAQEPQFTYVEYVLLLPLRALGIADQTNIVTLYNIFNFIGVFALILLIYSFALELKNDRLFAAIVALFVVGGYTIIYNKTIGSPELSIYGRTIFPYLSSIAFFIFIRLVLKSLKSAKRREIILAGLAFGSLFYVFFYAWSFAIALLGSLIVVYLAKKEFFQVKKLATIAGIGLILGAYNLVRLLLFYSSEHGRQLAFFLSSYASHAPIVSKIGLAMIAVLAVYQYRRRTDNNLSVIFGFVLAGWVALNQQIISGHMVQHGHYYWFFIVPISIVLGGYMLWELLPSERLRKVCFAVVMVTIFFNSSIGQYRMTSILLADKSDEQRYEPIIVGLQNDRSFGVVMAPDGARGLLITIYTSHDLLWNGDAFVYNTSVERMEDMLQWYLYLNKKSRSEPLQYLEQVLVDPAYESEAKFLYSAIEGLDSGLDSHVYATKVLAQDSSLLEQRRQLLDHVEKNYRRVTADPQYVASFLAKYGVSYVVWDKVLNPEWDLTILPGLQPLVHSEKVDLYRVAPH